MISSNINNIIKGNNYRFTLLSNSIIRMEYSPVSIFEDRPSSVFINRQQQDVKFVVEEKDNYLFIKTDNLVLKYKIGAEFNTGSLSISMNSHDITGTGTWYFGNKERSNLGGTARTLDGENGRVPLERGLFSNDGFTVIDDSKTPVLEKDGFFIERPKGNFDVYFIANGKNFRKGLKEFYQISGNPPLIPRYALGNWWSRFWTYKDYEYLNLMDEFEHRKIPLSVAVLDMDWHKTNIPQELGSGWTGYSWNRELIKDPKNFLNELHTRGLVTTLNLHPALGIRAHEDCYNEVAEFMGVKNNETIVFDLTNKSFHSAYFKILHNSMENDGVDFWWIDWQQGNSTGVEALDPLLLLNHYHFTDHGRDSSVRPFVLSRWSGLGGHRYPIGFSGDTVISWDSLAYQPEFTSTAANVGFGWWSHDIGGHYNGIENDELYIRWIQFGVFSPILRMHTSKSYYNKREPWRFSKNCEDITSNFLRLRHSLIPYIYSINHTHSLGDLPLVYPMYYLFPNENNSYKFKNQYFFGSEMLVAPVTSPMIKNLNKACTIIWLPKGRWFHYFSGEIYDGDQIINFYSDLDDMPVFVKAGAIVPNAKINGMHGVDLPKVLELDIFPGADNDFTVYEDDGISREYEIGAYFKTIISTRYLDDRLQIRISFEGDINVIPKQRFIRLNFRSFNSIKNITEGFELKSDTVSSCIYINNLSKDLTFDFTVKDLGLDLSFSYKSAIMNLIDKSYYSTEIKDYIGFIKPEYQVDNVGLLSKDLTKNQFINNILSSEIPDELKNAVISFYVRGFNE